jgi:hypothetical protein
VQVAPAKCFLSYLTGDAQNVIAHATLLERIGGHGKFDTIASARPIICEKTVCQRATGIIT